MEAVAEKKSMLATSLPIPNRFGTRFALVLGFACVLFFARLSERALWSEEVRWAQIPREMVRNGDYLWPTINGQTYYDKPLGSYWLVLLASLFTGGIDETTARLPSACSGLLAVAFAMLIARRLYDEATAIWTGIILATSFSFVFFARTASADIENVAGVLAALWIYLRNEDNRPGWWTLALWFVMALTSLTKGLLGFVLPVMIIGVYSALKPMDGSPWGWQRQSWLLTPWSLAAIPLGAFVFLTPFLLSIVAGGSTDGLEMVYRENIRRFYDPVNHRGPIYFYTYVIFMLMVPWSLLLPAALLHAHFAEDKQGRGRAFALAYFWGTFIFFTLSSSRRSYYLLPILPAGALLIARLLAGHEAIGKGARMLMANLRRERVRVVMGLIAIIGIGGYYLIVQPALEPLRTQRAFADAVKQTVENMDEIALYRTREIVYYLDAPRPIREYHALDELPRAGGLVIMRRRDWEGLENSGRILVEEMVHPWESPGAKLVLVELR